MIHHSSLYNLNRELKLERFPLRLAPTVENVRHSCRALAYSPQCSVKIDQARAQEVIDGIDIKDLKKASHHMEVPLKFPDEQSEVNFHIVLHLFNFAHGYRHSLNTVHKVGAWQTMKHGIEVLQQRRSTGMITGAMLADLSREQIVDIFDIGTRNQQGNSTAHTLAELEPLVAVILEVAHDSGRRLLDMAISDFATFAHTHSRHPQSVQLSATWLVHQLATYFPAFDDRREWCNGEEVLFLKKAQLAVAELYQRFSDQNPDDFGFPNTDCFTVVCDNVLPCVLRALGVLILPNELLHRIDSKQSLPAGPEAAALRATAITAVEIMLEQGEGTLWAKEIGDFLWTLGKEKRYRSIERHATLDTCFY